MGLPVDITNRSPRSSEYLFGAESRMLPRPVNNLGAVAFPSDGSTSNAAWRSATPPTVTANAWRRYFFGLLTPAMGRCFVVTSITAKVTAACELALLHIRNLQSLLAGTSGINNLDGFNAVYSGGTTGDGQYTWHFPNGLYVRGGERVDFYGLTAGTTGFNFELSCTGVDLTDDFDYDLSRTVLVLGDSISGVTSEATDFRHLRREDGTESGMWPYIIKSRLSEVNKPARLVNIGVGGTQSYEWDWLCSQGRISHIAAGAMIVNLGMNNATWDSGLPVTAGTDGPHKRALKNICRAYLRKNPGGSIVINSITDTDVSTRLANVASGIYAGQTRLAAYRAENAAVVSDLQSAGIDIQLARTDLAYTTATAGAYISTESAGSRTHPSGAVGQPLMAARIWEALQATQFA